MQANRGRDTRPELALRRAVHRRGLRYRVGLQPVKTRRRTVDLAFTRVKVAVFLDGCFWHGCPEHYRQATGETSQFWEAKIEQNRRRDADTDQRLSEAGWEVVRVWEHEDPETAADRVAAIVKAKQAAS